MEQNTILGQMTFYTKLVYFHFATAIEFGIFIPESSVLLLLFGWVLKSLYYQFLPQ